MAIVRCGWKAWKAGGSGPFRENCYGAADWLYVGRTAGRGSMDHEHKSHGQSIKDIYLYPLIRDARQHLCGDDVRVPGARRGRILSSHKAAMVRSAIYLSKLPQTVSPHRTAYSIGCSASLDVKPLTSTMFDTSQAGYFLVQN